jgi:16S rRNA C967 or C1407 C5-methylase (RsmB/RsmF family)
MCSFFYYLLKYSVSCGFQLQGICPEEEWDEMMESLRRSLPTSFRITASRSESKAMLHILEKHLIRDAVLSENKDEQVDIKSCALPW